MFRWIMIALAMALSGCVGVSNTRFSQSRIEGAPERFQKYVGTMHVLPAVDLHVEALNSMSKTLMVLPIPFYESERKPSTNRLLFFVSIVSKKADQVLLTNDFEYVSPAGFRFIPVSLVGPYDCGSAQPRPAAIRSPLPGVSLSLRRCHTMLVEFAAPVPDPAESFSFVPGALRSNFEKTPLPVVHFAESTRGQTVAVP